MSLIDKILALRRAGQHEDARSLAVSLVAQSPNDAELQYQTACLHDFLGREAEAISFYVEALSGTLSEESQRGAYLGLGSTYRALGQYALAEQTFREGLKHFKGASELTVFLAMALHNLGQSKQAVELLLKVLAETSNDAQIQSLRKAILFYAQDIDRSWPT